MTKHNLDECKIPKFEPAGDFEGKKIKHTDIAAVLRKKKETR